MTTLIIGVAIFVLLGIASLIFRVLMWPLKVVFRGFGKLFTVTWFRTGVLLMIALILFAASVLMWEVQRPAWYPLRLIPEEDMKLYQARAESFQIQFEESFKEIKSQVSKTVDTAKSSAGDQVFDVLKQVKKDTRGLSKSKLG